MTIAALPETTTLLLFNITAIDSALYLSFAFLRITRTFSSAYPCPRPYP